MFNEAGAIHIVVRRHASPGTPDEQIEYYFEVAMLGAKGITREISEEARVQLGPIADKHGRS